MQLTITERKRYVKPVRLYSTIEIGIGKTAIKFTSGKARSFNDDRALCLGDLWLVLGVLAGMFGVASVLGFI